MGFLFLTSFLAGIGIELFTAGIKLYLEYCKMEKKFKYVFWNEIWQNLVTVISLILAGLYIDSKFGNNVVTNGLYIFIMIAICSYLFILSNSLPPFRKEDYPNTKETWYN